MGVVVAARHLELDERVAVKFMAPDALSDPAAITRFEREVRTAARLRSEYVARVYDAGRLPDGWRYMVLEYLPGEDLSARVLRSGPLEPAQAVRFILQACSALADAHELGIVHRDIKPANLRVVRQSDGSEIVKVLDFGIVKRMPGPQSDTDAQATQPGTIVGTPLYTSPEQLRGSTEVDHRADVWSLGASLFELLTGVPPFGGTTYPQVIANVLEASPKSLGALRPDLPETVEPIILRCLEKQPSARFGSVLEFARALADTIDIDPELNALLLRMERQHASRARNPRPTADVTPSAGMARLGGDARLAHRASPAQSGPLVIVGPAGGEVRKRLLLTSASAAVACLVIVLVGLPWLPHFESARSENARSQGALERGLPALASPVTSKASVAAADQNHEDRPYQDAPPVAPPPVPSVTEPPKRQYTSRKHPTKDVSHTPAPAPAPARTLEPISSPSATVPAPTVRHKNPLLAGPR
jgi:serine/threonine-protein kinase